MFQHGLVPAGGAGLLCVAGKPPRSPPLQPAVLCHGGAVCLPGLQDAGQEPGLDQQGHTLQVGTGPGNIFIFVTFCCTYNALLFGNPALLHKKMLLYQ